MANECADGNTPVGHADRVQLGKPVDVDEVLGAAKSQCHHRKQALPAGEDLGLVTVLGQQRERFGKRLGSVVGKRRILHRSEPIA